MTVLIVVETVVLAVLCVLVAGLLRGYATLLRRLHDLDGGGSADEPPPFRTASDVPAPVVHRVAGRDEWSAGHDLDGTTLLGEAVHLRTVGVEHDTLLAFLSSGCTGCVGFWDELARPGAWSMPAGTRLVVVCKDADDESPAALESLCPPGVDLVMSTQAWADYEVPGSPFVIVVDGRSGRVKGQGSGGSFSQLTALVAQALGDTHIRSVRKPAGDVEREADVDRALFQAGILPGDPSLYEAPADSALRAASDHR
jgi:hypothetical protein